MFCFGSFAHGEANYTSDVFSDYKKLKNEIAKVRVLTHMKSLIPYAGLSSLWINEIFTGEKMRYGIIDDGDFTNPLEFIHYYENYDIGIPYEYEEYLKNILK